MEYIAAKTIVTRNKTTAWFGCEYNMNIYKGCCHGCIYCDSRSECYGVENFDQVRVKENALEIIGKDLRHKVKTGIVATGSMSDPYNPFEKELQLTRHGLELLDAYGFGAAVATKSDLILRDIDIFKQIQQHSPVLCKITITSGNDTLSQKLEPGAPVSSKRFETVQALSAEGVFTGILLMPVLPFIQDSEENILSIITRAAECGARFIYPMFGVTLRQNQRIWFLKQLDDLFPGKGLKEKYIKNYGNSYVCNSPRAKQLWKLFTKECDARGLLYKMQDIIAAYKQGYGMQQLRLFE